MTTMTFSSAFQPTKEQSLVLAHMQSFAQSEQKDDFLILKGAAGTGKTSMIRALVNYLEAQAIDFHIAAPTGRAAKVISAKTGHPAKTVHSLIYTPEALKNGLGVRFNRKFNLSSDFTVFIIDEASMLSNERSDGGFLTPAPLLTDLFNFIKQGNPANKVIFIGDEYQLPPVGSTMSPALSAAYLQSQMDYKGKAYELLNVMRQAEGSYILDNALGIRQAIKDGKFYYEPRVEQLRNYFDGLDFFCDHFDLRTPDHIIVIGLSNKAVYNYNRKIREKLGKYAMLEEGDLVVLKSTWMGQEYTVANGETARVLKVQSQTTFAGLKFAKVKLEFRGMDGKQMVVEANVFLSVLENQDGRVSREEQDKLFAEVMRNNRKYRESKMPFDDEYIGAMQVQYAYAINAHKAQGGEWEKVIVLPYYPSDETQRLRWMYTAFTRGSKNVYTFPSSF